VVGVRGRGLPFSRLAAYVPCQSVLATGVSPRAAGEGWG
jgi:hypothetical protein